MPHKKANARVKIDPERERRKAKDFMIINTGTTKWNTLSLKKLSVIPIFNGIFNDPKKVGRGCKLVNVVNLYDEPYINANNLKRLDISPSELKKFKVEVGDLLFTRSSLTVGGIAHCNMFISENTDAVFECHTMRIRPNTEIVLPNYLYYFCRSGIARRYFMQEAQTTTMTTIGQGGIGNLPVLLPPLPEQKAIASLLQTWDTAIEKTDALIVAKEQQFAWLSKTLILVNENLKTNKHWKKIKLGEICNLYQPKTISKQKLKSDGQYKVFGANGVIGYFDQYNHEECEIAITCRGATCGTINLTEPKSWITGNAMVAKVNRKKVVQKYLYYCLSLVSMHLVISGAAQPQITKKSLFPLLIPIPLFEEQKRIAHILNTAQKEIGLLKALAQKYRTQKRGLMQKLLTGIWRV